MSELQAQIDAVRTHTMPFYREFWQGARHFQELPLLTREKLATVQLTERRYANGPTFLKVVAGSQPFLSEWLLSDLAREPFGVITQRPFVYFASAHETVEKGMWCYLNTMTRFLGETNTEVTQRAAQKFSVDSMILDAESLASMAPVIPALPSLTTISVIGSHFDIDEIRRLDAGTRTRLVLALPESGVIGESDFKNYPRFSVRADCIAESIDGEIVLTRKTKLVTPIIRYATGILGSASDSFVTLV